MKRRLLTLLLLVCFTANASAVIDDFSNTVLFDWKALQLNDAVKEVRGNGARVFAIFTEPACGFCRKYEKTLLKVDNVTIYWFLIPLDESNRSRSEDIWCAGSTNKERLQKLHVAMNEWVGTNKKTGCANPIEKNVRFARKHDIYMTPTTIGSDGRIVQGYLPLVNLENWLSGRGAFDK